MYFLSSKRKNVLDMSLQKSTVCQKTEGDLDHKSHPGDLKTIECAQLGTCLTAQLADVFLLF